MSTMTGTDASGTLPGEALVQGALCAGADRHRARRRSSAGCGRLRHQRLDQGARRRLHQADQDGDRADHLLHRGVGHRPYPGRPEGRPGRRQGAGLFRDRLVLRAGDRPGRRQSGSSSARASARMADAGGGRRITPSRPKRRRSVDFVLNIIPDSVVGAFAKGDILQVLLFSILFGFALMALGERGHRLRDVIDDAAHASSASSPS